ncbi:SIS (Sugar ISomerase) domain containing transcriptional regulator [Streptococcus pneumoniae]|nr:SIS (Sugar ISomerase) domain containing transcriptional regulator [Streptococcus pneumoniae]VMN90200.1 SIS (Sugar ISomerase) domain containing transcriptional regulator [Streptococcus pneumoniae]VOA30081.1 SIS (Sugar ISomerase) domain containing transcriptional regulator [Streptococcus pneumoniae]VQB29600.1 SIS (Sugar ISomerase) domain containing transcriptional regulator [Streptococcus pneumoniae]VTD25347.1 SIS (Sugar ISomerase) domain containing transcriptional regulator [Streptococcus pne
MLIRDRLLDQSEMTEIEVDVANYFLEAGYKLKSLSSRSIAKELFVAPSTITRFCQWLGFEGYNAFKEAYLTEVVYLNKNFQNIDPNKPFNKRDQNLAIASRIAGLYQETVHDSLSLLNHDILQKATRILEKSNNIQFGVVGDAYEMAETFKNRMIKIGKQVTIERRLDNLFFTALQASNETCFVLISYSGETESILKIAEVLKQRKLPTIVLTSFGDNSLSQLFDLVIRISTRESLIENLGNFSSLISISFILDSLYASYFQRNFDKHYERKLNFSRSFEKKRKSSNPLLKGRIE